MTEIQIKNLIKEYEKEYIEFMEIEKLPQYKIDFFEINVEESDAAGFASAAQAYYNTKTDEHILRICKSSEIPRYIVFHEFTHILDTEMYAKQDSWKYMALSGYTEYHAAQVELMIMLGADSIQTQDFSFTVDVEIGNSTVRNYLNSRHQLVVNMMNRTDFPRDIEALKTTVGVLYNYFGVRSICKMYAKDYTEEVDNTIIIQKLSKVLFEEINSFMVGWFNEAQVELSFVSYMKIMWPMLQSYFGKEWKIVTVNTVLYTVKPSKINAWGELATFYYPIWWYVAPTIINTFLEAYDFSNKIITLFATSGSSGFGNTAQELKVSAPNADIKEGLLLNNLTTQKVKELLALWLFMGLFWYNNGKEA